MSLDALTLDRGDRLFQAGQDHDCVGLWESTLLKISGIGTAFPSRCVNNADLARDLNLDPRWIDEKCGVRTRFISSPQETTISLGAAAAAAAMRSCPESPDLVVCCTCTPALMYCPIGPSIAAGVNLNGIGAFDLNAACSGGLVGLIASVSYLVSGFAKRVLLVCTDTMTKHLSAEDRSTRILFGDGAAALVLEQRADSGSRILSFATGSDGRGASLFGAPQQPRSPNGTGNNSPFVKMDGPAMFRFAVDQGSALLKQLCTRADVSLARVARVIIHQSNARITRALQHRVPIPAKNWILNLEDGGNITSVSVILSLIDCLERNDLEDGDLILLGAFGAGLTWAGLLVEWHAAR